MPGSVFLSYRRDDTAGYARGLYDRLRVRFPGRVFMDVGEIAPGTDFMAAIEDAIGRSRVLLVLIGKRWLSERVRDPADYVRLEIATSLKRGIRVIPVLVGGGTLPDERELPEDLALLPRRQAVILSDAAWDLECEQLIGELEKDLGRGRPAKRLRWTLAAVLAAICGIVPWVGRPVFDKIAHSAGAGAQQPQPDVKQYVESEKKGLDAITSALDGVTRKIQDAGATQAPAKTVRTISGRVLDANGKLPLADAEVVVYRDGQALQKVYTDASGHYALRVDGEAGLVVQINKPGYAKGGFTIQDGPQDHNSDTELDRASG